MSTSTPNAPVSSDVLHSENHSKLSAEEIAKAVQRHNRHHPQGAQNNAAKPRVGAKHK